MKYEKFLPIGTVVLLKNATKKIMITGFYVKAEGQGQVFDYTGCIYPEGVISSTQNCVFNHNQIDKIYHIGMIDEEEKKFKEVLKKAIEKENN